MDVSRLTPKQLAELAKTIAERQAQIDQERLQKLREKITKLCTDEGTNVEQLFGFGRKTRRKPDPKYRNPANPSETWAGRGKEPKWYTEHLAKGKPLKALLIER